jgi:23S rRNA (guanosine2251-2'-O)-methyltransferase
MKEKTEILYGIHPVHEALRAEKRAFREVFVAGGKPSNRVKEILRLAESRDVPVKQVKPAELRSLSGSELHQGVGAQVSRYPYRGLLEVAQGNRTTASKPMLLLLDTIKDPQNLGAILRTALCAGVGGVIIPKDRSASPSPAVSKASAGALEHIALSRVTNLTTAIKSLRKEGFWVTGLDVTANRSIYEEDFTFPLAMVVGSEEKGIRPLVRKQCDFLVSIPQAGEVSSLNASVATGIALYEAVRQMSRQETGAPGEP